MMKRPGEFWRAWRTILCTVLMTTWLVSPALAATGITGKVTFNGLPVPGATVTAAQGDNKVVVLTDEQGAYTFGELGDGAWTFKVEMPGFATQTQDVTVAQGTAGPAWELKILSLADITQGAAPVQAENTLPPAPTPSTTPAATAPAGAASTTAAGGQQNAPATQRPAANAGNNTPAPAPAQAADTSANSGASSDLQQSAASSLVVNGSVNNGAASPFAQMAAFGNNRRGPGLFYNGNFGASFDTSAWDAQSFSLKPSGSGKPSYNQLQFLGNFGGPIGIPRHYLNQSNFVVNYQHGANDTPAEVSGLVPTLLEQQGNFSQTLNAKGQPVQIYEPGTTTLFPNETLTTISPQAQALLSQYPQPNISGPLNFERSAITTTHSDALQSRFFKNVKNRNQINGSFGFQRQVGQNDANIFDYTEGNKGTGLDGTLSWSRTYRPGGIGYFNTMFQYEYNRQASSNSPFFANRTNVSKAAGIEGNDQSTQFWGPPTLAFGSSGTQGLSDTVYSRSANDTQTVTYKSLWYRGKHSFQFGGDMLRLQFNSFSQQNPRGTFTFNGDATSSTGDSATSGTGYDLADFLLGVPDSAKIAFGNADKYLRGWRYDAYFTDDWRVKAGFTADIGVRWEFATPLTEIHNRLANMDVSSDFSNIATVPATDPTGAITGRKYPNSLLNSDYRGIEPRIAVAWRPRSNSPLVVRAGYGVYDMTSIYQVIATQMAQQPPFSTAFSLTNNAPNALTLQTAFTTVPSGVSNTFGVDPNFRIGYAQQWNASVQQDLPGSLVMTVTYNGIKGTRLMQEYMPNTYTSLGLYDGNPVGFTYLSSGGNSTRESGTAQLRRRLRDGLTATLQYTYSKSLDDASAFSGASIVSGGAAGSSVQGSSSGATSIAQNWQNLRGERGPSTFDQRNLMTFSTQYTTGEGLRAGALMSGWRGTLFKDWTFLTNLTLGSGLPLTPIWGTPSSGTGLLVLRPDTVPGVSVTAAPPGAHLNSAAFRAPAGEWGDAGRNSLVGPSQFGLSASFSRTFRLNGRMDATWETDATNVLNTVTASSWNTNAQNSSLFGTPAGNWNAMRKLQTTIRVRY